jgi:peptidoglycan/xylan/chitin deacetylase (PgdA/CDA1 family)
LRYYLTKTPAILKPLARDLVWNFSRSADRVFLTFDDGPVPGVTDKVLDILDDYGAKATFFVVGENAMKYPELFQEIKHRGHQVGNHTFSHLNGWKTSNAMYVRNILKAHELIQSDLFRPPYGKITRQQVRLIKHRFKIIMWDSLSGDFDRNNSPEICVRNALNSIESGSISVFHDSEKAKQNVLGALPLVLAKLVQKGFIMKPVSYA